eukprot:359853-Chlamydomonas_euryale.AAC.12
MDAMHAGSARDGDSSPLIGGARQQQHQHQHPLQQQAAMEEAMGSHLLPFSLQEEPDTKARRPRLFFMVWVLGVALAALLLSLVVVLAWLTTAEARTIQYVCPENITDGDRFVFVVSGCCCTCDQATRMSMCMCGPCHANAHLNVHHVHQAHLQRWACHRHLDVHGHRLHPHPHVHKHRGQEADAG